MFIGEYQHNLDPKKRVALPVKFRSDFKAGAVITRGLDSCLFVYPKAEWDKIADKLGSMPVGEKATRSFVRLMLAGAVDVKLDSQGRVLIPEYLKEYSKIKKEVTVAGLFNRLELWDSKLWEKYKKAAEKDQDKIAEELGKLGMY
ncbi:MAG TPA: division/cell wall cluster transcriptional repressor MraZ [Candidatus Moranbacteria bacterium]|nr:division/cell wall cluster transcriptional repressor MraZ [Candidatus Moranbacteria bacterium]